jgi:hypothetical protein
VATLFDAMDHPDLLVRMRAADALEKLSRDHPDLLRPGKRRLLGLVESATQQELRWHLAQMIPRLALTPRQVDLVARRLVQWLEDSSAIVRANALDALVQLARAHDRLGPAVRPHLRRALRSPSAAVRARARRLRAEGVDLNG